MNAWPSLLRIALAGALIAVLAALSACGSLPPARERPAEFSGAGRPVDHAGEDRRGLHAAG
jgi:putative cardiolipin synthase